MSSLAAVNADMAVATFELFPTLPIEIRLKIWRIDAHQPRQVEAAIIFVKNKGGGKKPQFKSLSQVPAVLHANREARAETLKFFTKCLPELDCSQVLALIDSERSVPLRTARDTRSALAVMLQTYEMPTSLSPPQVYLPAIDRRIYFNPATDWLCIEIAKATPDLNRFLEVYKLREQIHNLQLGETLASTRLRMGGNSTVRGIWCLKPPSASIVPYGVTDRHYYMMARLEHGDVNCPTKPFAQAEFPRCMTVLPFTGVGRFTFARIWEWNYHLQWFMIEFVVGEGRELAEKRNKWWNRTGRGLKRILTLGLS